ncbi:MAG: type II toxin-antitoxin system VapB family antitoxin [Opitutales bacterium]
MKTTIDIPDEELESAMRFTGSATKREAVVTALRDFNRRHRMARLVRHSGTFTDLDTNEAIEAWDAERASRFPQEEK